MMKPSDNGINRANEMSNFMFSFQTNLFGFSSLANNFMRAQEVETVESADVSSEVMTALTTTESNHRMQNRVLFEFIFSMMGDDGG